MPERKKDDKNKAAENQPASIPPNAETCEFRKLISKWLNYSQAEGLAPKTLLDYREKIYKFYWWWREETRYYDSIGQHPRAVTTQHAREFATYLRTPWRIAGV